jgi:hypothetical protein
MAVKNYLIVHSNVYFYFFFFSFFQSCQLGIIDHLFYCNELNLSWESFLG